MNHFHSSAQVALDAKKCSKLSCTQHKLVQQCNPRNGFSEANLIELNGTVAL